MTGRCMGDARTGEEYIVLLCGLEDELASPDGVHDVADRHDVVQRIAGLRNAVQQFARLSARGKKGSPWAKGYLSDQLARGHSVSHATRALGNRWLAIIFRLWQDRVAYDEEIHLRNRALRGCRVAT